MDKVVSEQAAVGTTWTWTAPATDYTGYLVDVYRTKENGTEVILGTIAVDVSSDWTRFPRMVSLPLLMLRKRWME